MIDMPVETITSIVASNIEEAKTENPSGFTKEQFTNFFILLIEKVGLRSNAADYIADALNQSKDEDNNSGLILHKDVDWFFQKLQNKDVMTIYKLLFVSNNPKCLLKRPTSSLVNFAYAICPDKEQDEIEEEISLMEKKGITEMDFSAACKQWAGIDISPEISNPYDGIPVKYVEYIEPKEKDSKSKDNQSKCCLLL